MAESLSRTSGLDGVGPLAWGSHFCQFYQGLNELEKKLVPYFEKGLEANELCVWITSGDGSLSGLPGLEDQRRAGQIEVISYSDWYEPHRAFAGFDYVFDKWGRKLESCRAKGYDGLRLAGDTAWLQKGDWANFLEYERKVNRVMRNAPVIALCTYPMSHWEPYEILDIAGVHQFSVVKRNEGWASIGNMENPSPSGRPVWLFLNDLMDEIRFFLSPLARQRKVPLEIVRLQDDLFATTNPDKLRRMVMELLENALKYASPGSTVTISVEKKGGHFLLHGHVKAPDEYSRDSRFSVVLS